VGGPATRLHPLTLDKPKALIEFQGKTILEHVLDLFQKYDIDDIVLSTGYLKDQIRDHFKDGKDFGMNINYIEENEPLGTAGPLNLIKKPKEACIVCNGDELKEIDIPKMLDFHKTSGAKATLALRRVEDPSIYGVAEMHGTKIRSFVEKPKKEEAPSNLINAGFYIMEPEVFDVIPKGRAMFEYDVFPKLASEGALHGYEFDGQWFDTGNHERLKRARDLWTPLK